MTTPTERDERKAALERKHSASFQAIEKAQGRYGTTIAADPSAPAADDIECYLGNYTADPVFTITTGSGSR